MHPTTDVYQIKAWAEALGGKPQVITSPEAGAEKTGLRISFPGEKSDLAFGQARTFADTTWEDFGRVLRQRNWGLIMHPHPNPNNLTDAYQLVPCDEPLEEV